MDQKPLPKRNYTFLGLVTILFLSILILISAISLMIARVKYPIKNLQISNLTATSATITWETEDYLPTQFRYTPENAEKQFKVADDRGVDPRYTHMVTLKDLTPNTIYQFNIGDETFPVDTSVSNFTTQLISDRLKTPMPIYGQIAPESGAESFSDVLVHYRAYDPNNKTYSEYYTAIPNEQGRWSGEIFSIRDEWGDPYFSDDKITSLLTLNTMIAPDVLGENTNDSYESFENANGESSELIEVTVSNGNTQNTSFTPISADISEEIITVYLNDIVQPQEIVRYAPEAPAAYCTQYQTYALNYCSNTVCPVGRNCAPNALTNADVVKCVARSGSDVIADCCASGATIQNGACVAPGQCTTYGSNPLNSCTNTACPTGRNCASRSLTGASNIKCLSRTSGYDYIYDCCPSGYIIENGACKAPGQCTTYGSNPLNSCTNATCPTGRNCAFSSLTNASNVKCLSRTTSDNIMDCCASGATIQNGACVSPGQCTTYGSNPLNTCTNTACPTGRNCKSESLTGASNIKCLSRTSGYDYIYDCCPSGATIQNGACVSPGQCTTYGSNPLNTCTNTACPTGRNCKSESLTGASNIKCLSRSSVDYIYDCCPSGYIIENGACVAPGQCTTYGSNPLNSCSNATCPTGRNCAAQSLTGASNVRCLSRTSSDNIYDCCASGATIQNGACVSPGQCSTYGGNPLNSCSNTPCPSGRYCASNALTGADAKLCLNRVGQDEILDCCPQGYIISGSSCVPSGSVTPSVSGTPSVTPTGSIIASPTPTQVPVNPCTVLTGDKTYVMQTGQRIIDEQIIPFISSQSGYASFPITFVISGNGAECSTGDSHQITCGLPKAGDVWLTGKLIFHEVMHNYKSVYGGRPATVISELMASLMEGYFTRESCMGGEYTFYGLGDGDHTKGRKPDLIRNNSGLSAQALWQFAITGNTDMFTSTVVNRIVPGGWEFAHIFCNGYRQWGTYYDGGVGCGGDTPRALADTFDINMDIFLSPAKLNDFDEGEYRLDLSYKTLTSNSNETDKTVPVRLNNGCNAGDPTCQVNDVAVADVYVNSEAQDDPRYDLNVSLNSDVKNDLNCWNRDVDMQASQDSPINMELNLEDMSCSYSFGGIPVECSPKDLSTDGIVAPWQLAAGASQSQGYSGSHPGIDVTAEDGSTLVAAQDGTVIYTRRGAVKDSIYFDSVRWGTKCEEGSRLSPDSWVCLCDWCPLEKVRTQAPNRPDVCNAQRDCVARAEELQRNSPDWSVDGALHRIYGNVVIIEHQNHRSIYSHMGSVNVAPGNCVRAGDVVGTMSSTGSSSGPHIHFEVRSNAGTIIDPSGLRCDGNGCSLMGFMPGSTTFASYLGLATDELPDFYEGDIDLSDQRPLSFDQGVYEFASPVGNTKGLIAKQDDLTPTIFIDGNGNNKADEGETKLASAALENLTQIEGLQDIRLNNTWNLVVFNSSSSSIVTTKDLAELAELSGMHLEIASYDLDRWNIATVKQEGSEMVFYGNEFNILPQRAFFIKSTAPGTYYHSGAVPTSAGDKLELQAGWNFFSLSAEMIDKHNPTSYSLLQSCNAAGVKCSLFSDFNGQLENPVIYREEIYGKDYKLEAGKGYVMKVDANPGTISF